jgi:Spy/CpxP family protein refolding chaperone
LKKLNLIFGLVLFLFLLSAPLALAQMGCMQMKGPGMSCGMMEKADELGLTAEQQAKIKTIHLEAKKEEIRLKADIELAELDLKQLMMADTPNQDQILKAVDNLGLLKTKMAKAEIKTKLAMQQILTKEQLAKWKEMKKECCGMGGKGEGCEMKCMQKMMKPGMMMGAPEQVEVKVEKCMKK